MVESDDPTGNEDLKTMTLEELNNLLNDVLEGEDYIRAIAIRDEINSRRKINNWISINGYKLLKSLTAQ